jgi:hypothetical protein
MSADLRLGVFACEIGGKYINGKRLGAARVANDQNGNFIHQAYECCEDILL